MGYLAGTLATFLLIYFTYRIGENKRAATHKQEIAIFDKSAWKEMNTTKYEIYIQSTSKMIEVAQQYG
ncbi:hypothetical protein CON65_22805 [Bacillus pseudomycoides]|uniref:Uncharacterized protein n=1 Tax=Bacillus pseudomycoides TaxID=64104 RepID=A0AA91ZS99_9BACI|nr:hypothetical protein [Bacillus sp. AFS014408]PEB50313.1 hypothetical protein COO03_23035 [Bacillus sp. AFS098217]PED80423.1 hypothetical protein CON65_22805 [Bacillus pseudomycoides]PEU17767.1 hypothetical protein CN524_01770 [Bacillus sp. AFS019443]PFW60856.1 hypothetical protein COL20_19725 [Bacillus sp. AFS075034]PEU12048.1 hypothetical protein CN525_21145 [Bacillus sp. AFS014408]